MKFILALIPVIFLNTFLFAQSADKGRISVNFGAGISIMKLVSSESFEGSGLAVPTNTFFSAEYNTHNRVSLGLETGGQNYRTMDSTISSVKGGSIGLSFQYYFLNRPKANAFVGTSVGGFNMNYAGKFYPDDNSADSTVKDLYYAANGVYNTLYVGYNLYFLKFFGLHVKGGFNNYPARMDYVSIDNSDVELFNHKPITDWHLLMRGGFVNIGLTFKFRNPTNKTEVKADE